MALDGWRMAEWLNGGHMDENGRVVVSWERDSLRISFPLLGNAKFDDSFVFCFGAFKYLGSFPLSHSFGNEPVCTQDALTV